MLSCFPSLKRSSGTGLIMWDTDRKTVGTPCNKLFLPSWPPHAVLVVWAEGKKVSCCRRRHTQVQIYCMTCKARGSIHQTRLPCITSWQWPCTEARREKLHGGSSCLVCVESTLPTSRLLLHAEQSRFHLFPPRLHQNILS